MWWLYQASMALALALAGPFLLLVRGRHYRATLPGRLGLRLPREPRGALWLHAVSVGEAAVAATLARALPAELGLVVTTITPTGQERAARALAGRATVAYAPFELGPAVGRFFAALAPRALVLVEGDYWPLLLREAKRRGLPVAVVNGRISDRSFPRLLRFRGLVGRLLLERVDRFGVQTGVDRDRLLALGVPPGKVTVTGNLKFEAAAPARSPALEAWAARLAAGRPLLVAGSTMPGEETLVLDAFAAAGGPAAALLVVAPRHPERFDAVAAECERRYPGSARRSSTAPGGDLPPQPPLAVLDSLGELAALYGLARAAFVGGTLVPRGGHNPLEPARFGVPVAVGPSMENFREIADGFDVEGAWARVDGADELGRVWRGWLAEPERARQTGERGRALVERHRGALERTLELLAPLLSPIPDAAA